MVYTYYFNNICFEIYKIFQIRRQQLNYNTRVLLNNMLNILRILVKTLVFTTPYYIHKDKYAFY